MGEFSHALQNQLSSICGYAIPLLRPSKGLFTHELVGSGFLYYSLKRTYLVTARHVIDEFDGEPILTAGDGGFVRLPPLGRFVLARYDESRVDFDICIGCLPTGFAPSIHPHSLATGPRMVEGFEEEGSSVYALVGYTASKNKSVPRHDDHRTSFMATYYGAWHFGSLDSLNSEKKNNNVHVVLSSKSKKVLNIQTGLVQRPCRPDGMSGGPVFKLGFDENMYPTGAARLVGVVIEHHGSDFVVTRFYPWATDLIGQLDEAVSDHY